MTPLTLSLALLLLPSTLAFEANVCRSRVSTRHARRATCATMVDMRPHDPIKAAADALMKSTIAASPPPAEQPAPPPPPPPPPPAKRPARGIQLIDRAAATAAYMLPAMEVYEYGGSLYRSVPALSWAADAIAPIVDSYHSIPFASLIYFLVLSAFVVNADGMSRFVKFNIQQALFLDMIVLLPLLFAAQDMIPLGAESMAFVRSAMWSVCFVVCGYAVVSNARGELPDRVPGLSQAAGEYLGWLGW